MTGFTLTGADERKLVGVDSRLVNVVRLLAQVSPVPFMVVEGMRMEQRQRQLFRERKTKTLDSKHLRGRAVDIAPLVDGKVSWEWKDFAPLIKAAKECSMSLGVPMTFGYDWGWDAPHMELKG